MSDPIKWLDRDDGPVDYGEPTYWERRYTLDRKDFGTSYRHDWYFDFERLRPALESYFGQPIGQRILLVGCGLSTIASQLHAMGYRCITALDISATAIALMQAEDQDKEGIEYVIGDARKMDSLPDDLFECIFDKGCADSLMCGYRSTDDVVAMFHECYRVLRPDGVFLCVSHGEPDARMHMFQHDGLQWYTNAIPMHGSEGLLTYVCTKWSRKDIEAADRRRLDDLESLLSMRAGNSHSQSTRRVRGIMHQNLIAHARAPHELDAAKQQREDEEEQEQKKRNAEQAAAKAAAESSLVPYEALPEQADQGIVSILGTTVESLLSQEISQLSLENSATIGSSSQATVINSSNTDKEDLSVSVLTPG